MSDLIEPIDTRRVRVGVFAHTIFKHCMLLAIEVVVKDINFFTVVSIYRHFVVKITSSFLLHFLYARRP